MPIVETPSELKGTKEEDELSQTNKGPALFFASNLYDKVVNIVEKGIVLNEKYEIIEKYRSVAAENIKEMTKESAQGKIFYIFNLSDVSYSNQGIDKDFIIKHVAIIIAGGKRYKIEKRGKDWLERAESPDFNFIEIKKGGILDLIENDVLAGGDTTK